MLSHSSLSFSLRVVKGSLENLFYCYLIVLLFIFVCFSNNSNNNYYYAYQLLHLWDYLEDLLSRG